MGPLIIFRLTEHPPEKRDQIFLFSQIPNAREQTLNSSWLILLWQSTHIDLAPSLGWKEESYYGKGLVSWEEEPIIIHQSTTEKHYAKFWEVYRSYNKPLLPGRLAGKIRYIHANIIKKKNTKLLIPNTYGILLGFSKSQSEMSNWELYWRKGGTGSGTRKKRSKEHFVEERIKGTFKDALYFYVQSVDYGTAILASLEPCRNAEF